MKRRAYQNSCERRHPEILKRHGASFALKQILPRFGLSGKAKP